MAKKQKKNEKAELAFKFIQNLTNTKGKWAGKPFVLLPWQEKLITDLYGDVDKKGIRRKRLCYCEIPKKNGKSELAAAIALKQLVADGEIGGEVYSAAADRMQAGIVYSIAASMVRNNKYLSNRLKIIDSQKRIVDEETNSFYQVLSSEAYTKHGINPSAIVFDELHAQPDRELWDTLVEGTDTAREQQLIFAITTAGIWNINHICWEIREHARQVIDGIIQDDSFLPVIYSADINDDWESPDVWKRVNPSLGYIFDISKIQKHYEEVKVTPARQNNFRRFRLNQWVQESSRWISMEIWDSCRGNYSAESLRGRICFGGLDLSSTTDLSAFVLVFPPVDSNEHWKVLCKAYIPERSILIRAKRDRVPYLMWKEQGYITATPGNVIDYEYIKKDILNSSVMYKLESLAFDPWGAVKLSTELSEYHGINMVEFRQGYKSMSPAMKELYRKIISREIEHDGNPVLRWCADNVVITMDPTENIKADKSKSTERIDLIVALVMSMGGCMSDKKSIYESRGVITL